MAIHNLLSFCEEVAHFFLSVLHLLFTQILPLVAMLAGSLLLHIFRFITSLFFTKPSKQTSAQLAHAGDDYYDDAQEELVDDGASVHEECYEDCDGEDFVGLLSSQEELDAEYYDGSSLHEESNEDYDDEDFVEDGRLNLASDEGSERLITPNHQLSSDSQKEMEMEMAPVLISQPSFYPSDLPPNLDAAANPTASLISMRPRTLPPSLSNIQRTLRELSNSNKTDKQIASSEDAGVSPNFMTKFQKHFRLDG